MEDKQPAGLIPDGWEFKTEVRKNGSERLCYWCPRTTQRFSSYEDMMRYIAYAKKAAIYSTGFYGSRNFLGESSKTLPSHQVSSPSEESNEFEESTNLPRPENIIEVEATTETFQPGVQPDKEPGICSSDFQEWNELFHSGLSVDTEKTADATLPGLDADIWCTNFEDSNKLPYSNSEKMIEDFPSGLEVSLEVSEKPDLWSSGSLEYWGWDYQQFA